jgi:hypothetical protein
MRTQCYSHAIDTLTYDLDQGSYTTTLGESSPALSLRLGNGSPAILGMSWHRMTYNQGSIRNEVLSTLKFCFSLAAGELHVPGTGIRNRVDWKREVNKEKPCV